MMEPKTERETISREGFVSTRGETAANLRDISETVMEEFAEDYPDAIAKRFTLKHNEDRGGYEYSIRAREE